MATGGDVDRHVGTGRKPERADPPRLDVVARDEIVECRRRVLLSAPAVGVDRPLAVTGATTAEEQHAVAVTGEHPCVADRAPDVAVAARHHEHRNPKMPVPAAPRAV
jgi:hypothetical protein